MVIGSDNEAPRDPGHGAPSPPEDPIEREQVRAQVRGALFAQPVDPVHIGRFTLIERLGAGGMGVVHLAYDPKLRREVAVKLLVAGSPADVEGRERLVREAQAMASLSHPNVLPVFEVGEQDDQVFIVMEMVRGQTLRAWMDEGPHGWREVVSVFRQAGAGLAAAHKEGLAHRDFKPDNAMIDEDGRVRVMDFGLARQTAAPEPHPAATSSPELGAGTSTPLTRTGAVLGTPAYMSPEQLSGAFADAKSDQFSYCVALYEALYGQRPFAADTVDGLARAIASGEVPDAPPASRVPAQLRRILLRGLDRDPAQRFATMTDLLDTIGRDPVARRRRVGLFTALGLAVAAGGFAVARVSTPGACAPASERLAGVWDAAAKIRLRSTTAAASNWEEIATHLDAWSEQWATFYEETCAGLDGAVGDARTLPEGRLRCLEWQRQELEAIGEVGTIAEVDLEWVFDVGRCRDDRRILAMPAPPVDPDVREDVQRLQGRLAHANALDSAGRIAEALAVIDEVIEGARGVEYRPTEARALLRRGEILVIGAHRLDEGVEALRQAVWTAEAGGDLLTIAQGSQLLGFVFGYSLGRPEEGLLHARRLEAVLERMGGDPELEAGLILVRGGIAMSRGDLEGALHGLEASAQVADNANAYANLSVINRYLGRFEQMREMAERSLAKAEPEERRGHEAMAVALMTLGYPEQAEEHLQTAAGGVGPSTNVGVTRALGLTLAGRPEQAVTAWMEELEGTETDRPLHFETSERRMRYGHALLEAGRFDEAQRALDRALDELQRCCGDGHRHAAIALTGLGRAHLARGEVALAVDVLERALVLVESTPRSPSDDADTRFALARALVRFGGDQARARALATAALRGYETLGPGYARWRTEIEAWLDEQPR